MDNRRLCALNAVTVGRNLLVRRSNQRLLRCSVTGRLEKLFLCEPNLSPSVLQPWDVSYI